MTRKAGATYASHPLVKYVRSLPDELYLAREAAEQIGCSKAMLLVIARHSTEPMGPTHQAQYGGTTLHLYTPARIEAIRQYLDVQVTKVDQGYRRRGPVPMWTNTERIQRRRDSDRAKDYRRRAVDYRARGMEKEAKRMDRLAASMAAQLERTRQKRWGKSTERRKHRAPDVRMGASPLLSGSRRCPECASRPLRRTHGEARRHAARDVGASHRP